MKDTIGRLKAYILDLIIIMNLRNIYLTVHITSLTVKIPDNLYMTKKQTAFRA